MGKEQKQNQNNLKENTSKESNLRKNTHRGHGLVTKLVLPIVIIAILAVTLYGAIFSKPQIVGTNPIDPELARAMEYNRVKPGEEKIVVDKETNPDANFPDDIYPYVTFDAFFFRDLDKDGIADGVRGTCNEIGEEDTLWIELKLLTNGYLEDGATITLNGDRNFYFDTTIVKDGEIKNNYVGEDTSEIILNQIGNEGNGVQKTITGIVKSGDYKYNSNKTDAIGNNINNYSKDDNTITFEGVHVKINDDGTQTKTKIKKTVKFQVDWYGEVECVIPYIRQISKIEEAIDEQNSKLNLEFSIYMEDTKKQLNLSKSWIQAEIPLLNTYPAENIIVTTPGVTYKYEKGTRILTAENNAKITEQGIVEQYPTNEYRVKVTYPMEAYESMKADTVEIMVPIQAQYEGRNNKNTQFSDPYISNIAKDVIIATYEKDEGYIADFEVTVGQYISEPEMRYVVSKQKPLRIYNEVSETENEDYYTVKWLARLGSEGQSSGIKMKETEDEASQYKSDEFINVDAGTESMEEITSFTGIAFSNPAYMLGEEGEIKVYDDETGILLVTFNKDNWNQYSEARPYTYEIPVKHIRIETSATKANSSLTVYHRKELDDGIIVDKYERENFDNLKYIQSTLVGYVGKIGKVEKDIEQAAYEAPLSVIQPTVSTDVLSTQETEKNYEIKIKTETNKEYNEVKWTNGAFLLKLPKDIIDVEINNVDIDNRQVTITSYEKYEEEVTNENQEKEKYRFIKINTENDEEASYTITINCNITPDPRIPTTPENIEIYAYNESNPNYYYEGTDIYDVNDNLNETEKVSKNEITLSLISPNSLLTSQFATDFDEKGSVAVAPQVAEISKNQEKATIKINVTNNYSNTISDVKIIGKIPTTGNTYVINGSSMGSNFDATMLEPGLVLPEGINKVAKIYYSEKENVNNDITDIKNEWKDASEQEINFENVKSFLISLEGKSLEHEDKVEISYEIKLPSNLEYNQVSYSHHAVYFSLDTGKGKYKTYTEPNKLGIRVSKKYDLELTKYQKEAQKTVGEATYYIWQEGEKEGRTRVTGNNGKFVLQDLYLGETYNVKEIKSPEEYELNTNVIKFKTREDGENLVAEFVDGMEAKDIQTSKEGDKYKVALAVEDEVKANLVITKVEKAQETQNQLKNVRFKITGEELGTGKIIVTNNEGKAQIKGLNIGKEYTIEEVKADGYYLISQKIKFTISHEGKDYTINVIEPEQGLDEIVKNKEVTMENEVPTANFTIQNEKIPTYNLTIKKVEKGNLDKVLSGAKFKLIKDGKEIGRYETGKIGQTNQTGVEGQVTIENLYACEEEKGTEQIYKLKEVYAPQGYTTMKDIQFKVTKANGSFSLEVTEGTVAKTEVTENNITITIEDSPTFKITKQEAEGETNGGKLLPDTKFVIYNIDEGTVPARNSKGELIGSKETINGIEYNVVTTDSKGEIIADLPQGLYKAVEVQASDEKYELAGETYFGIGESRGWNEAMNVEWTIEIADDDLGENSIEINTIEKFDDESFLIGGYISGEKVTFGEVTITNENYDPENSNTISEGIIMKISNMGEIEEVKQIKGPEREEITEIEATNDGGYIVVGNFDGEYVELDDTNTLNNENESYENGNYAEQVFIAEYDNNGKIIWTTLIQNLFINDIEKMQDGGFVISGIDNLNDNLVDNGMIIKYKKVQDGYEIEWSTSIEGVSSFGGDILETSDGGFIVGGSFYIKSLVLDEQHILTHEGRESNGYEDAILIKYKETKQEDNTNKKYDIEWANSIERGSGENVRKIIETEDKGFIVGIISNDERTEEGTNYIIKYNKNGTIEKESNKYEDVGIWLRSIVKINDEKYLNIYNTCIEELNEKEEVVDSYYSGYDNYYSYYNDAIIMNEKEYIVVCGLSDSKILKIQKTDSPNATIKSRVEYDNLYISSIFSTKDNGYIMTGFFNTDEIKLDEEHICKNIGEEGSAIIAKYNENKEIEWVRVIGNADDDGKPVVQEIADGGYIIGVKHIYSDIVLDNGQVLDEELSFIKYDDNGEIEWTTSINISSMSSLSATSDGGFIISGEFYEEAIIDKDHIVKSNGSTDAILIKYGKSEIEGEYKVDWAKAVGGSEDEILGSITQINDGGYVAIGISRSNQIKLSEEYIISPNYVSEDYVNITLLIIKYNNEGKVQWATAERGKNADVYDFTSCTKATDDGGYIIAIDDYIAKYSSQNVEEWKKDCARVQNIIKTEDNGYIIVAINGLYKYSNKGEFEWIYKNVDEIIEMKDNTYLTSSVNVKDYAYTSMLTELKFELGVGEQKSILVQNKVKNFNITTEVQKINNVAGGSITGEEANPYETVKYGESNEKDGKYIIMRPEPGYELVKVTINGERTDEFDKQEDGSYKLRKLTNIQENKHIVVTYMQANSKFVLNKKDENGEPLAGAKFRIEQKEDREITTNVMEDIVQNEEEYSVINKDKNITNQVVGTITSNGPMYVKEKLNNVEYVFSEEHGESEYYFVKNSEGAYEPTNSQNYTGNTDKDLSYTTAHSYFKVDLTDEQYKGKKYAIEINARVSGDYDNNGYATITDNTEMPYVNDEKGRFMRIHGDTSNKDYTSMVLEGGNIYYLHLGHYKGYSGNIGEDRVLINSINLYEVNTISYNFEKQPVVGSEETEYKYVSTNARKPSTIASSYIPLNLEDYEGQTVAITINAEISSENEFLSDYGFAVITDSPNMPESYYDGTELIDYLYGDEKAKDYTVKIDGGTTKYLHFVYEKNESIDQGTDTFTINSVKAYETKKVQSNFNVETVESEQGTTKKYISNNKGYEDTSAKAYIKINLAEYTGKYDVIVNAEISSEKNGDYGYAIISESAEEASTWNSFMKISGEEKARNYVTTLEGESEYYLHFVYEKNNTIDGGEDIFTINDVKVVPNGDHLYKTEVTTDKLGQIVLSLPTEPSREYKITEIEAPEGYELIQGIDDYTMKEEGANEITIQNTQRPKLTVHHYKDGTREPVADDEEYFGTIGEKYEAKPKTNLAEYELARYEDGEHVGEYKIDGNPIGTYTEDEREIEVTYYYTNRKVPLIVHHYIEGTTNRVPLKEGGLAPDEKTEGVAGTNYQTQPLGERLSEKYELVKSPEEPNGIYQYPKVELTYEYRLKTYEVTTKVQLHEETDALEVTRQVAGGNILGEGDMPYETVEHGESNTRDIIATPEANYQVKEVEVNGKKLKCITINGVQVEENQYTVDEETGAVTLNKINNITENQEIVVEFEKIQGEVIVNHYIYDESLPEPYTTNRVHSKDGQEIPEQIIKGAVGDIYVTKVPDNLKSNYKLYKEAPNSSGTITKTPIYVNYYYIKYGAAIENNITKDGTQIITSKDEEINYKIKYTANIEGYTGNAIVTITDTLPYKLDENKMKQKYIEENPEESQNENWLQEVLNGGQYNKDAQTITWTQEINVAEEESQLKELTIEKAITVIFEGVNVKENTIINTVKGSIYLESTGQEQETPDVTHTTETKYVKAVKVTKTWEHGANIYERPTQIKVKLKNAEKPEEALDGYEAILSQDNNWTHTFTDLPKYNEDGNEIRYIVEEEAVNGESLDYYKREL